MMIASPLIGEAHDSRDLADGRDAEGARHDRHMARGPPFLEHQAAQARAVIIEKRGGAHIARHDDRVLGQLAGARRLAAIDEGGEHAVREIVDVVEALAQIGIGLAHHPRARIGLHALDAGFRRQAGIDGLADAPLPTLVIRQHAHGLEHVAMLAVMAHVAALDEIVDRAADIRDGHLEPRELCLRVVGDEVPDDDARIMQDDMAETHALGEARPRKTHRAPRRRGGAGGRGRLQVGRGDGLGEHHRGRLQRLDLVLAVEAARAVLHHEHAEHIAEPQDRHAEEGLVDLLARLRLVGEGGMASGVGEVDGLGLLDHEADEAFARLHGRHMHRFARQSLGGVELEHAVVARHIDRADLGHDVGRDQAHDPVETGLRADGLGHRFAQPPQQQTRSAESWPHGLATFRTGSSRP